MLILQLLGGRRLLCDGQDVGGQIRYRKSWAVLGYLAVARGRQHSRALLAEWLWPGMETAAARTNLRQVLTDLNQLFDRNGGSSLLEVNRDAVSLLELPGLQVDLAALAATQLLSAAADAQVLAAVEPHIELLGGEFMAGFALADCPQFEEWLDAIRREFSATTTAALQRLCLAQQAHGRLPQAIATARKLVATDGLNEEFQRQLMRLLAAGGLHQQALEQYQAMSTSLMHELGVVPEPRTQALYAELRAESRRAAVWSGESAAKARETQARHWLDGMPAGDSSPGGNEPMTQRTLPVQGQRRQRELASGWLTVERGPWPGRRIAVGVQPVVVGRGSDSDLCLPNDTVSRQHCMIWHEDGCHRVRDLGSTNGTRINGALVQEAALEDGDDVVLGEIVLRFGFDTADMAG